MRLNWLLLLFLPATCWTDGLTPSINDVPLFWGLTQNDPVYKAAAFKAQEAFFIQSGVTQQCKSAVDFASKVFSKVESTVASAIDNHTPLNHKHVLFVAVTGHAAFIKKEITQTFKNPLLPTTTNTVSIGSSYWSIGIDMFF